MNLTTIMLGYYLLWWQSRDICLNTIDSVPLFCFVFGRFDVIYLSLLQKGEVQKDFGWGNRIATWLYYVRFF